ncbi:exodeoxyribonuclease VII small subunit [Quisquiliibacterium transsilvanicum]|jgi:exodeoxyribonuclease VII small subunit|uniref:Exodeoxyribonuclease 7 small subunit n=1 Tax=Quisquiliibacterium transsilvanicum TaxID=1549638 RepID=A0A7W8M7A9_9BURK|nr:exodeoxyribonuclease VII small subunit [Quisquiliibacterium transsilvanicum]MBB5270761.1 exodeoxyribonuclease VII small subunit [Quisquiliibacterium transsilvanicum]
MVRKAGGAPVEEAQPSPAPSFEDAIGELERLVERMESGSLSLEDSLAAYRRGAELAAFCRKSLAGVQQQVKVLEGELLRPFEGGAAADADEA